MIKDMNIHPAKVRIFFKFQNSYPRYSRESGYRPAELQIWAGR